MAGGRAADVTDVKEETYEREKERERGEGRRGGGGIDRDRQTDGASQKTPFKHC